MSAHAKDIPELDAKGLREFGLTTGAIVVGLFGLFFPWVLERPWPFWPWIVGGVLAAWALAAPATLRGVYRGWMRLGLLLGKVTTPIVMGAIFFVIVTPAALVIRLAGRDLLGRRFDPDATTYRVASERPAADSLKNPF